MLAENRLSEDGNVLNMKPEKWIAWLHGGQILTIKRPAGKHQ